MPFPHLFSPIQMGNIELPNRIVHVPTDISSSHADGEVSERDIHHHTDVARGGTGFVIVGATTPDLKTGRPTVTCLVADGDNYIPGLARLAEGMHRYGAKCAVQLQHPGRQCAIPRYNTLGATDRVLKLPWSAGHEIIYENAEEKGKEIRAASIAGDPRAGRPLQRGRLAGQAGRLRRRRAPCRARLPAVRVHEPVPQHAHRPVRRQLREPDALPARRHRLDPEEVRQELPGPRPLLVRGVVRGRPRAGGGDRDGARPGAGRLRRDRPLDGHAGEPRRRLRPAALPAGLGDLRGRGDQEGRQDPGHHEPLAARPRVLRADPGRGQDRPRRPGPPDPGRPVLAGEGAVRQGEVDPALHLLPGRLLAGVAHGQEGDRLLHQRGLRQPRLREDEADRAAGPRRGRRRRAGRHGGGPDRDRARPPGDAVREARRAGRGDALRLPGPGQGEDALVPGLDPRPAS